MDEKILATLERHLFEDEEAQAYAVLDGASVPDLLAHLYQDEPEYACLYSGELGPDMAEVAPYLVRLAPDTDFTFWLLERGWGQHWGIYARSPAELPALRRHLRTFLRVYDSDCKPLYFRYYDPRVLRVYLPTCNAEELAAVFGPVESYLLEDEPPTTALRFRNAAGVLKQEKLPLAQS